MRQYKWSIYQMLALILLFVGLFVFDQWMKKNSVTAGNSIYIVGGLLFLLISWIYITFYLQYKKHPKIMKHRVWKFIPIILFFVGVLSIVLFIILVTMGPFLNWLEKGSLLLYPLLIYTMILYFFFIISLVQRFSTNDENILHQAYGWSLGLLIVIAFIF